MGDISNDCWWSIFIRKWQSELDIENKLQFNGSCWSTEFKTILSIFTDDDDEGGGGFERRYNWRLMGKGKLLF
jgi:hypothetical protein